MSECIAIHGCGIDPWTYTGPVELWHVADFGTNDANEQSVADLIDSKDPHIVLFGGDNDYVSDYSLSVTPYYGEWMDRGMVWPVPGNHDWDLNNLTDYLAFFTQTEGRRYYDIRFGVVHLFMLDSGINTAGTVVEPDGNTEASVQGAWLQAALAASTAQWKVVVVHHPPFSSDSTHGSTAALQWPFKEWGAHAVIGAHGHVYERLLIDDMLYIVNGLGGQTIYAFGSPVAGSAVRYNSDFGALKVRATFNRLEFSFKDIGGTLIDKYALEK